MRMYAYEIQSVLLSCRVRLDSKHSIASIKQATHLPALQAYRNDYRMAVSTLISEPSARHLVAIKSGPHIDSDQTQLIGCKGYRRS
jgi:hypothetical protein